MTGRRESWRMVTGFKMVKSFEAEKQMGGTVKEDTELFGGMHTLNICPAKGTMGTAGAK